jgi:hypothetical protein
MGPDRNALRGATRPSARDIVNGAFNCPAVDLDFVMAEHNHGLPVALIEYKERHAKGAAVNRSDLSSSDRAR